MEALFKLRENNTTARREIQAGLTTFFAMAYIIFLNPVFLSVTGMDADGVLIATCISAAIGSLLCALISNKPFALASGMGMNAYFAYTLCAGQGYTWQQALAMTFLAGIVFLVIVISPVRDKVIDAIPANLKHAISVGIGLFIAVIGFLDAGIIKMCAGYPELGDLTDVGVQTALFGLFVTVILVLLNVKGNLVLGMLATVIVSLFAGQTALPQQIVSLPSAISGVFLKMDFKGLTMGASGISGMIRLLALILSMAMVDMFDTLGFLIGAGTKADMLDEDGGMPWAGHVMIADASATVLGAVCGTSTVTCYAESASGIAAGGRTGLTSATTAVCFLLAAFFAPLAGIMSSAVTAPALIIVGIYLMMEIKEVKFDNMDDAVPVFLTILAIPLTYSITTGIAIGFISYVVCKVTAGKWEAVNPEVVLLAAVFLLHFFL